MKIRIEKDVVTFTPEHAAETAELDALWIKLGNCLGDNKSLEPLGVYQPTQDKTATFHIAGLSEQEKKEIPTIRAMLQIVSAIMGRDYKAEKARTLETLGLVGGPRCCKRNVYLSILTAVRFLRQEMGVQLPIPSRTVCRFSHKCRECLESRCPFYEKK